MIQLRGVFGVISCAACVLAGRVAVAQPIGAIDDVGPDGVAGWVANAGDSASLTIAVDVLAVGPDGAIGAMITSIGAVADGSRPDVPAADARVAGANHGFRVPFDPAPGFYMVRVRTATGFVPPGEVRVARQIATSPRTDLWFRWRGLVDGMQRAGDYESYATAMLDSGTYRVWFAGGPGDKIYYASSTSSPYAGFTVAGAYTPVLSESTSGPDDGLTADPSVVRVPFPDPAVPYRFFMSYTAAPSGAGVSNQLFGALSTDGIHWDKMNGATRTLGAAGPLLGPLHDPMGGYGAGQGSLLWYPQTLTGATPTNAFVMYYSDTTAPGPCVAVSTDGGWSYARIDTPLPGLGDYTWDMKLHAPTGRTLGAVAIPGDLGADGHRHGSVRAAVAADGLHFASSVSVPMVALTPDTNHQCINNGGLLGDATGVIQGDTTVFYVGAGWGMQSETIGGVWGPTSWDMGAIEIRMRDCGPGNASSPCAAAVVAPDAGVGDAATPSDAGIPRDDAASDVATHAGHDAGAGAGDVTTRDDGGAAPRSTGGCGCRTPMGDGATGGRALALLALGAAFGASRRRRRH